MYMIEVLKQSTLFLELLIGLLPIAEKSFDLYELLGVVGFSVLAEVPGSAVFIIASRVWRSR